MNLSFSSDQVLEGRIENRIGGGGYLEVHFVCHSFKIFLLLIKMPKPSSSGDLSAACPWMRREAASLVKLFSSPGSAIFGPLGICELTALEMS